ncbi:MAG: hypothetical protein MJZ69_09740 [Bacteroidaceae bacterium]|nr:hypothetical protein [Bacteroidaceae bacterium]
MAQTEVRNDSLRHNVGALPDSLAQKPLQLNNNSGGLAATAILNSAGQRLDASTLNERPLEMTYQPNLPQIRSNILNWGNGGIMGRQFGSYDPIMGSSIGAQAIVGHQLGRFSVQGVLEAQKHAMPYLAYNTWAASLSASFRATDNISISAFGTIQNNGFMGPKLASNFYNRGAFFTFTTNNQKWGVDMGAQQYFDPTSGRWHTIPILKPFYNLNGTKLGFDVGGLVYQIVDNIKMNKARKAQINIGPNIGPNMAAPNMGPPAGALPAPPAMAIPRMQGPPVP